MSPRMTDAELHAFRERPFTGPLGRRLLAWWEHCEQEHEATILDYRRRVKEWHTEHHPDCDWQPNLRRWTRGELHEWLRTGQTPESIESEVEQ